ncbi:hypothetical protein [Streptomyces purpureus]|uniref:Uncharacterized protein n=1 Tax=Streptomyces purpureus TaxID=1951 RepID=A0A918LSL6_9ACTN|nr:hypothetical protein [Streptomyces purpureus]GGT43523.1 hypothetical protein GCM10014713_41550 [Streptomyces purpureus]
MTDYDRDPEALAWARTKVQHEIDRANQFVASATTVGDQDAADRWSFAARHLRRTLIGGEGCVMGRFDERLPELHRAVDNALPAAVDRAVRRDHSLCGAEPCSDCR